MNGKPLSESAGLGNHEILKVFSVLPNLRLEKSFETKFVGLLPDTDPRVAEIAKRDPAVYALINGFFDQKGIKCSVSVLVVDDIGVNISLWVSAFEILVHPGKNGKADLPAVCALLSKAQLQDRILKRRRQIKHRGKVINGKAVEFLYSRLYEARNDFLHGNPVTPSDAIFKSPKANGKVTLLNHLAPLLYQVALLCDFDWFIESPKPKELTAQLVNFHVPRAISLVPLQNALKATLTGKERRHL